MTASSFFIVCLPSSWWWTTLITWSIYASLMTQTAVTCFWRPHPHLAQIRWLPWSATALSSCLAFLAMGWWCGWLASACPSPSTRCGSCSWPWLTCSAACPCPYWWYHWHRTSTGPSACWLARSLVGCSTSPCTAVCCCWYSSAWIAGSWWAGPSGARTGGGRNGLRGCAWGCGCWR